MQGLHGKKGLQPSKRAQGFVEAAEKHETDFQLLMRERILATDFQQDDQGSDQERRKEVVGRIFLTCIMRDQIIRKIVCSGKLSASFFGAIRQESGDEDVSAFGMAFSCRNNKLMLDKLDSPKLKELMTPELLDRCIYDYCLNALVNIAEANGMTTLTYSVHFEKSISDAKLYPLLSNAEPS